MAGDGSIKGHITHTPIIPICYFCSVTLCAWLSALLLVVAFQSPELLHWHGLGPVQQSREPTLLLGQWPAEIAMSEDCSK